MVANLSSVVKDVVLLFDGVIEREAVDEDF